jgi:hypothetical protein
MRFIAVPIIVAAAASTNFSGCKTTVDPAATDVAVEGLNGTLGLRWTDEQKKKYSALADLKKEDCVTTVTSAYEDLFKNAEAQKGLNAHAKTAVEPIKQMPSEAQTLAAKQFAGNVCEKLAAYKNAAAGAAAGGAPPAGGAAPAAGGSAKTGSSQPNSPAK